MYLLLYVHVYVTRTGWKTRPRPKTVILPIKKSISQSISLSLSLSLSPLSLSLSLSLSLLSHPLSPNNRPTLTYARTCKLPTHLFTCWVYYSSSSLRVRPSVHIQVQVWEHPSQVTPLTHGTNCRRKLFYLWEGGVGGGGGVITTSFDNLGKPYSQSRSLHGTSLH